MNQPTLILRQNVSNQETLAMTHAGMLLDVPVRTIGIEFLMDHQDQLKAGAMPVGSVEFLREAMRVAGFLEPQNMSYPDSLRPLLLREVRQVPVSNVRKMYGENFIKPVRTKLFTGFTFDLNKGYDDYDAHEREQIDALMSLPDDELLWTSSAVKFVAEWRCYVLNGDVIGIVRYDDHDDEIDSPTLPWLESAAKIFLSQNFVAAFVLDVGLLEDGRFALVEVNDAWAVGLYKGAMDSKTYMRLLWARWKEIAGVHWEQ